MMDLQQWFANAAWGNILWFFLGLAVILVGGVLMVLLFDD